MRIAAVQHDIVWEDRDANFARLAPQVARASSSVRQWFRRAAGQLAGTRKTSVPGPACQKTSAKRRS